MYLLKFESLNIFTVFHIWLQTFFTTGLFIITHDSMHGSLAPNFKKINKALGVASIFMYAGFQYSKLKENHFKHHEHPATEKDPDYTGHKKENLFVWIKDFVVKYYGLREFIIMHLHVGIVFWLGQSFPKVILFFAIPAWLSALQLFYFGTYLPHKGFEKSHKLRTRSNSFPGWLSLITCYHFGYHKEHHLYPGASWWELPGLRALTLKTEKRSA